MRSDRYVGKLSLKKGLRLLLFHPVAPSDGEEGPFPLPPFEYLLPATQVDEIFCLEAPHALANAADVRKVIHFVLEKATWAESQGYDAVVINCMLDPGVREARSRVSMPVVGIGEATRAVATLLGGFASYIYPPNIPVLQLADNEEKTFAELTTVGRKHLAELGADVLIPGCAYIGGLAQRLQRELGVPVLPNLDLGLRLAELLATFRIRREGAPTNTSGKVRTLRRPRMVQLLHRVLYQVRQRL